jgi:hypothetical protein
MIMVIFGLKSPITSLIESPSEASDRILFSTLISICVGMDPCIKSGKALQTRYAM